MSVKLRSRNGLIIVTALAVACAVAGGIAYAAIPSSDGTIKACYTPSTRAYHAARDRRHRNLRTRHHAHLEPDRATRTGRAGGACRAQRKSVPSKYDFDDREWRRARIGGRRMPSRHGGAWRWPSNSGPRSRQGPLDSFAPDDYGERRRMGSFGSDRFRRGTFGTS